MYAPPDMVLFLTGWLRKELALRPEPVCKSVTVSHREPDVPPDKFPKRLITVSEIGGNDLDAELCFSSVSINVAAGSKENPADCIDLSRIVYTLLKNCARIEDGNPVAKVEVARLPVHIPNDPHPRARRMMTFDFVVVGEQIN